MQAKDFYQDQKRSRRASRSRVIGVAVLLALGLVAAGSGPASAYEHGAYSHEQQGQQVGDWMGQIAGDRRLSQLSIPGTHDTMAQGAWGDIAQTQSMSLQAQLDAGIRWLDIRGALFEHDDTLHMYHGAFSMGSTFDDVLATTVQFLRAHPSETVLMRLKQEHTMVGDKRLGAVIAAYIDRYRDVVWEGARQATDPQLDEIRGKIVILQNFAGPRVGLAYPAGFSILDDFHLATNWDLYSKWEGIRDRLIAHARPDVWWDSRPTITYLSGSGGSFPYFVASGRSSPQTGAPLLSTGLTTPGWAHSYPDFPRIACFIGICTIAFQGTNALTDELIRNRELASVGIVVADFPGPSLIRSIIDANRT